jgi:hypothetical protein
MCQVFILSLINPNAKGGCGSPLRGTECVWTDLMNPAATPVSPNDYVAVLKRNGAADQSVIAILRNAGWPEREAVAALASYYEALTGVAPPPRGRPIGGPREAFLHLLGFITLSTWCVAAGSLWFALIESWFPDPAVPRFGDPLAAMAWNLAAVLVGFPVFLLVMRTVWRERISQPAQADSAIRRWLTYVAMLIAAASVIGDFIVFVEHLLRGEMSAPFAAKAAIVLLLAGGVFYFFLHSMQSDEGGREARLRRLGTASAAAASGFVLLTIALSFTAFGSPAQRRLSAFDDRRSEDLKTIARVIRERWAAASRQGAPSLPASIQALPESTALRTVDPVTGQSYRYEQLTGARYRLCATFQTDTTSQPVGTRRSVFRVHPAGAQCFDVDALLSEP